MYFHENNISFGKNDIRLRGDFIKDRINVCLYIRIRQTWGKFYNVQKGKISFFQIFLIKDDKNPPILIVSPPSNIPQPPSIIFNDQSSISSLNPSSSIINPPSYYLNHLITIIHPQFFNTESKHCQLTSQAVKMAKLWLGREDTLYFAMATLIMAKYRCALPAF